MANHWILSIALWIQISRFGALVSEYKNDSETLFASITSTYNKAPAGPRCTVKYSKDNLFWYLPSEVPNLTCTCVWPSNAKVQEYPEWTLKRESDDANITNLFNSYGDVTESTAVISVPSKGQLDRGKLLFLVLTYKLDGFLNLDSYHITIRKSGKYGICNDPDDCSLRNAVCIMDTCNCRGLKHNTEYECYSDRSPGENCDIDDQCLSNSDNSFCSPRGICECNERYEEHDGKCTSIRRRLGERCDITDECLLVSLKTYCSPNGICECKYPFEERRFQCELIARGLGETCVRTDQCSLKLDNSYCSPNGICECISPYEQRGNTCNLIARDLGERCEVSLNQCSLRSDRAYCSARSEICECIKPYHQQGRDCVVYPRSLGEPCTLDEECSKYTENSYCTQSRSCDCRYSYYKRGSTCSDSDESPMKFPWVVFLVIIITIIVAGGLLASCYYKRQRESEGRAPPPPVIRSERPRNPDTQTPERRDDPPAYADTHQEVVETPPPGYDQAQQHGPFNFQTTAPSCPPPPVNTNSDSTRSPALYPVSEQGQINRTFVDDRTSEH